MEYFLSKKLFRNLGHNPYFDKHSKCLRGTMEELDFVEEEKG